MDIQTLETNKDIREAYGLVKFAGSALKNTQETEIGKYDYSGKSIVTVVGYQIREYESPVNILREGKIPIEKGKFKRDNVGKLVRERAKDIGLPDEFVDTAVKRLEDFEQSKTVTVPFPEKTAIKVFYEHTQGMKQKIDAEVIGLKYVINRDTLKGEYLLDIKAVAPAYSIMKPITDFGNDLFNSSYDGPGKVNIGGVPAVQFSRLGYVKTIKIHSTNSRSYIIDNCFVYVEEGNKLNILGSLKNGGIEVEPGVDISKYENDKVFKGMLSRSYCIMPYIGYIMPYGLGEVNEI